MASIIEQIAGELQVSSASVSRALNDRPGVSDSLRQRILLRARELNYAPGITARGLATSQTFTLGFFVREKPDLPAHRDPFYSQILRGVEQVCADSDYHVAIGTLTEAVLNAPQEFRFTRERRIDGMILAGPDIPTDFILAMHAIDIPLILVDNKLRYMQLNSVNTDDEDGGYRAAHHLIDGGHTCIGILSGPREWNSSIRRVDGYRRALHECGLPLQIVHVERTTIESGAAALTDLLQQYPDVTAVCAVNDSMAIGAIQMAQRLGRTVPDQLSVVGFDDIDWAQLNHPPLTTVNIPKYQVGQEAARRLLTMLADERSSAVEIVVSVELIERRSSQPLHRERRQP